MSRREKVLPLFSVIIKTIFSVSIFSTPLDCETISYACPGVLGLACLLLFFRLIAKIPLCGGGICILSFPLPCFGDCGNVLTSAFDLIGIESFQASLYLSSFRVSRGQRSLHHNSTKAFCYPKSSNKSFKELKHHRQNIPNC